jgi:hypothetical protein
MPLGADCDTFWVNDFEEKKMQKHQMQKYLVLMCLSAMLSACGQVSYKRGATGKDLADTRKLCQAEASKTDVEINQCLEKNGWTVHQLNEMDLFAVANVSSNRQNGTANEGFPSLEATKVDTPSDDKIVESESSSAKNTPSEAAKLSTKNPDTNNSSTKNQVKSSNPLDIYGISSWWKIGSNRATLETDMQSCETQLGEAHKPDHINQKFTLGMIVCMHQKGWKALKK